ncbi:MAG: hypothetical protein R6W96_01260 [Clostridia bacterium]
MTGILQKDRDILRRLGEKIYSIANHPSMAETRKSWTLMNGLRSRRPMVMVETSGILDEILPLDTMECTHPWAKQQERSLRDKILHFEFIRDDWPVEPRITYGHTIRKTGYGVDVVRHTGVSEYGKGSFTWDPQVTDIDEGLEKLRFREYTIDRETSARHIESLHAVFDGILPIEHRGWYMWTQGLTINLVDLIGMEGLLYAFYDQPEALHRIMAFMRDEQLNTLKWHEDAGLLFPNNQDDYVGSGGFGYTDELPKEGHTEGSPATARDMWGLSESQETVNISPAMFDEFIFPYQLPVISRFGLVCYGCCEPVEKRWHSIRTIPNLRRISVSPWSDQATMAENLGKSYVFSRKPNPAMISTQGWDEELMAKDIQETLFHAKGLHVEFIMKDVHTILHDAGRLRRWVEIVREQVEKFG